MKLYEIVSLMGVLCVGFLSRLILISQPFIDKWSWRQADMAMIAENFYLHGFDIFHPQINWAGNLPGYVGTEFPLVPFLASLLYVFCGIHEWVGRLISVLFFTASVPFFYLLARKVFDETSALLGVAIYALAPLCIFSSRSFMPDMASLCLSIAALYLFSEYLEHDKNPKLTFAATAICSLAILVKLPAIIIGIPFIYMSWKVYGAQLFLQYKLWTFFALSLILPIAWYVYIYSVATSNYPYHMFGSGGIGIADWDWYLGIWRRTVVDGLTPIVSAIAAFGIAIRSRKKFGSMFHWWLVAIVIFIVFAAQGNGRHPWYQLPVVPVAAAFAGQACSFGFRQIKGLVGNDIILGIIPVVFFVILGYLSYSYLKPWYIPWGRPLMEAGIELERTTPHDALVMIADSGDPSGIYYSKRKGWHFPQGEVLLLEPYPVNDKEAISEVERRRAQGASYLVFTKHTQWWLDYYVDFRKYLDAHYQRVNSTDHYVIFALK